MTHFRHPNSVRRGVTLLEMVLAMGLLVTVSSLTYWFYFSSISARERGTEEAMRLRLARVVLDRITTELRQAATLTRDHGIGLIGERERIELTTLRVPTKELARTRSSREAPPSPEYDLVKVEYKIARHPDIVHEDGWDQSLGLARMEKLIPRRQARLPDEALEESGGLAAGGGSEGTADDELGGDESVYDPIVDDLFADDEEGDLGSPTLGPDINWEELYAPEIHYLRFCYYDGYTWWDDWWISGDNPLPQLVMVTIGFGEQPPCGEGFGQDDVNEEFCECLNKDPIDCLPLLGDQYSAVVRVTRADPLFRSRVSREGQALLEELVGGAEE